MTDDQLRDLARQALAEHGPGAILHLTIAGALGGSLVVPAWPGGPLAQVYGQLNPRENDRFQGRVTRAPELLVLVPAQDVLACLTAQGDA